MQRPRDYFFLAHLWESKLKRLRPHREYRAGGGARHRFSHAAQKHLLKTASPVGAHDNCIRTNCFRTLNNRFGGTTFFGMLLPSNLL
jgi:hypothetical protein